MQRIPDRYEGPIIRYDTDAWLILIAIIVLGIGLAIGIIDTLRTFSEIDHLTEATRWLTTTTT